MLGHLPNAWGLVQSSSADGPHPDWQDAKLACRTQELPQAPQGTGFMSDFSGPALGGALH
jgi:hypothetical protein